MLAKVGPDGLPAWESKWGTDKNFRHGTRVLTFIWGGVPLAPGEGAPTLRDVLARTWLRVVPLRAVDAARVDGQRQRQAARGCAVPTGMYRMATWGRVNC